MIVVQVDFQAADGDQFEKFKQIAVEARKITLQEKGCIKYDFNISLHHPNLFCLYEEWEDLNALKEHGQQDHTKNMIRDFEAGGGKVTINIYEAQKIQLDQKNE